MCGPSGGAGGGACPVGAFGVFGDVRRRTHRRGDAGVLCQGVASDADLPCSVRRSSIAPRRWWGMPISRWNSHCAWRPFIRAVRRITASSGCASWCTWPASRAFRKASAVPRRMRSWRRAKYEWAGWAGSGASECLRHEPEHSPHAACCGGCARSVSKTLASAISLSPDRARTSQDASTGGKLTRCQPCDAGSLTIDAGGCLEPQPGRPTTACRTRPRLAEHPLWPSSSSFDGSPRGPLRSRPVP